MRIFISFNDAVACDRVCRLNTNSLATTTDLLQEIAVLCKVRRKWLIAKLKNEIINLRICQEWPLSAYPFKNGAWVIVDILPEGLQSLSPIQPNQNYQLSQISEQIELDLETGQLSSVDSSTSFEKGLTSWNKYFEEELEIFLQAVRQNSLQKMAMILKDEPKCEHEQLLNSIMQKKINFLTNQIGNCGRTALHWAVQEKNLDLVEFLLIKSASPNSISMDNYTPLQLSIVLKTAAIFQTLVSHPKIDLNLVSEKGTALHVAIKERELTFAKKLIQNGADLEIKNSKQETPRELAASMSVKLNFDLQTPGKVTLPRILRGKISRVSSFTHRLKQRFLLVNPFTDELIVYEDRELEDAMTISKIKHASMINNKSWTMKKQYFYFELEDTFKNKFTFASKHSQIRTQWVEQLNLCIKFVRNRDEKVRAEDQLIEVIDDEANLIKVHKRKLDSHSKNATNSNFKTPGSQKSLGSDRRISLFDIKSTRQKEQDESDQEQIRQSVLLAEEVSTKTMESSKIFHTEVESKLSNELTSSNVANSDEDHQPDFRESQILGSIIDNKFNLRTPQLSNCRNTVNFRESVYRSSLYEDKLAPLVSFQDFEILRLVGNGSFGKIYLARHRKKQSLFALKVMNKKKLSLKKQLKYAVGEANILKKITHPFVIQLHYSFQTPSNLFMVLDYCPHKDLAELLYDEDRMTESACRFYIAQLLLAINYLHRNKILYRDLKPENILIGRDGYIRLADFNLSKENDFSMSFCGSPAYLSPEMLEKKGVGFEADIYGIGCVLYEMMVGQPPFFDENMDCLYENIRNGKLKFPSDISKSAKSLITSLMDRNIKKRLGVKNFEQIKNHEFFKGFDWTKLYNKQIQIPAELKNRFTQDFSEMELEVIKDEGFTDIDYDNSQNMMNRVKNYTFCRDTN